MNSEYPVRSNELGELDVMHMSTRSRFGTVQDHEDMADVDVHLRHRATESAVTDRFLV